MHDESTPGRKGSVERRGERAAENPPYRFGTLADQKRRTERRLSGGVPVGLCEDHVVTWHG